MSFGYNKIGDAYEDFAMKIAYTYYPNTFSQEKILQMCKNKPNLTSKLSAYFRKIVRSDHPKLADDDTT